jgi:hypothetical protein
MFKLTNKPNLMAGISRSSSRQTSYLSFDETPYVTPGSSRRSSIVSVTNPRYASHGWETASSTDFELDRRQILEEEEEYQRVRELAAFRRRMWAIQEGRDEMFEELMRNGRQLIAEERDRIARASVFNWPRRYYGARNVNEMTAMLDEQERKHAAERERARQIIWELDESPLVLLEQLSELWRLGE